MIVAEILGGEGQVLSRVRLNGTCVAGSDRTCDLVLDDVGVEPRHLELSEGPDATVVLRRLAENGESRVGSLVLGSEAEATLPATVTLGAVVLRLSEGEDVRESGSAYAPTQARKPTGAAKAWALLGGVALLSWVWQFSTTYKAHPWNESISLCIGIVVMVLVWASAWALGNRLFGYRGRFHAHLATVSSWALIAVPASAVVGAGVQIVQNEAVEILSGAVTALLGLWLLYRHIGVASRWRPRTNAIIAAGVVAAFIGLAFLPIDTDPKQPVKEALTDLEPLPAVLYVTRSSDAMGPQVDKILKGLKGMKAKRSVETARH